MSSPQPAPPPRRGLSPTHWLLIGAALAWSGLVCTGICGGVLLLVGYRTGAVRGSPRMAIPPVLPAPVFDGNDWMAQRKRAELYQTALESVAGDAALKARLGDDIQPSLESEELFKRQPGDRTTEEIEFEIVGTKGKGTVTARAARDRALGLAEVTIQVTLEDASTIDIEPLERPPVPVR